MSSYWDTTTSGKNNGVGNGADPSGMTGKTMTQMMAQATFSGWDFTTPIWRINEGASYPYFTYQFISTAPTSVVGTSNEDIQSTVSWTTPVSNGGSVITNYEVTVYNSSGGDPTGVTGAWTRSVGSANTLFLFTGLTNGTEYTFKVRAINGSGTGPYSTASSVAILSTVPGAPSITSVVPGNQQVSVYVTTDNGGAPLTKYIVIGSGVYFEAPTSSPIVVTGLSNGTAYVFNVVAQNSNGNSLPSSATNSVTPSTIPDAPVITSVVGGNGQVSIYFTINAGGSPITQYTITPSIGSPIISLPNNLIVITGLSNGTTYTFTMTATNINGTSPFSNVSDPVTPSAQATVPYAPTNLAATVGDGSISLSWAIPSSDGGSPITDYIIEYKLSSSGTWVVFNDGVSTNLTAVVTSLSNDNAYDFRVSAKMLLVPAPLRRVYAQYRVLLLRCLFRALPM